MVNACARDHENLKNIVDQESCILVGNGCDTSFLNDVWIIGNYCLQVSFLVCTTSQLTKVIQQLIWAFEMALLGFGTLGGEDL